MATEVGAAYVSIYANTSKLQKGVKNGLSAASVTVGNIMSDIANDIGDFIGSGLEKGIKRYDTIQNFPKLMTAFGYSAEEAGKSVQSVADHLMGLPGSTDEVLQLVQALSDSTSSLSLATSTGIAFNDMLTAAGADAATTTLAMRTFDQIMGGGTITAQRWQSLTSKMPKQFNMLAENILGAGNSSVQLGEALQGGEVSLEQLAQAMTDLGPEFETQARALSAGIGTALENVPNRLAAGWAAILDVFGQNRISGVINSFSTGVKDGMKDFATWLANALDWIKHAFNQTGIAESVQSIADKARSALENAGISDLLKNGAKGALDIIGKALSWLDENFNTIAGIVGNVVGFIQEELGKIAASGILDNLGKIFDQILHNIIEPGIPIVEEFIDAFVQVIGDVLQWVIDNGDLVTSIIAGIIAAFTTVNIAMTIIGIAKAFVGLVSAASPIGLIVGVIAAVVTALVTFFTQTETGRKLWKKFTDFLKKAFDAAVKFLKPIIESIGKVVSKVFEGLVKFVKDPLGTIQKIATTVWNAIKSAITIAVNAIKTTVGNVFNAVKTTVGNIFNGIKTTVSNIWNGIKTTISNVINGIKTTIENIFNAIKNFLSNLFGGIKTTTSNAWNGVKNIIGGVVNGVKTVVTNVFNGVKNTVGSIFNGIKSTASNIWNGIKTTVGNAAKGLKDGVTNTLNGLKNGAKGIWEGMKGAASSIFGGIKNVIGNAISAAKGVVQNEAKKMQSAINGISGKTVNLNANDNISGACSRAQKSINGLYGKTVSVNFNAYQTGLKAIEVQERVFADTRRIEVIPTFVASGGIATKPTLSIWGEAGSEAIIPLSNRSKVRPFARAVAAEMGLGGGVTVTGNTFIVRDDSDIDRIADRINEKVNRARAGALR